MNRRTRHVVLISIAVLLAPVVAAHFLLRASLPRLDGRLPAAGIRMPVEIERDAQGIPTISAANRVDLAYATGFVHAQDRFFQMDLSRRLAAGELAELFGEAALEHDMSARLFRFRHVARQVIEQMTPEQRAILAAYVRGVNAGLESLGSRPWEYWALRASPLPWREEDTVLMVYAMWWDLQYAGIRREMLKRRIDSRLGGEDCGSGWKCGLLFLYPSETEWDAPNDISQTPASEETSSGETSASLARPNGYATRIPTPEEINVRERGGVRKGSDAGTRAPVIGSNGWAVSGALTSGGSALVASDMHLRLRVPAVWYRARLRVQPSASSSGLDVNGLMLPGAPIVVAGSNGRVAWGFTNSYGDWLDVEPVMCSAVSDTAMETPGGRVPLSTVREEIQVRGGESFVLPVREARSGVLFALDPKERICWLVRWLAQVPEATNFNMMAMESVGSTQEALALAPTMGIPHQNVVVGDREGHIGWSIFGRIPADTAEKRATGESAWTTGEEHPQIIDPPSGRLWTANARVTNDSRQLLAIGADEAILGAEYDLGARAAQIRDALLALEGRATPADMLRIQLDDRASFLSRWRELLLSLLNDEATAGRPRRAEFRRLVAGWHARATPDSVGYHLVRAFRNQTEQSVWTAILRALDIEPTSDARVPAQFEGSLWRLVSEQPIHMLPAEYADWRSFLLTQLDITAADLQTACGSLAECTWGARRPVHVRHPLSGALPFLSKLIDMPVVELPGDHDMPRVQDGAFGASQRFAVSPGRETEGYLHYPGGQSGHPLSPFYRAGFEDWAEGRPSPFLPGPPRHSLILQPR